MEVHYEQNVYALNILQNKEVWELFKECHKKGGEKVRPYFEVKVVKAKKIEKPIVSSKEWTPDHCPCCGQRTVERKGNWVNGENPDKIKFPCFCRWNDNGWVGMLIKDWKNDEAIYTLVRIDKQTNKNHTYGSFKDLKEFIKSYRIHILKGKIIIFEEE